jgi:hypothetical protein
MTDLLTGDLPMLRFICYSTYQNEDVVCLTEAEFYAHTSGELPLNWCEYLWLEAADKAEALACYDAAYAEFEADLAAGAPIKETY